MGHSLTDGDQRRIASIVVSLYPIFEFAQQASQKDHTGLAVRPRSRCEPLVVLQAGLLYELKYRAEAHYNGRDASLAAICERVAHC